METPTTDSVAQEQNAESAQVVPNSAEIAARFASFWEKFQAKVAAGDSVGIADDCAFPLFDLYSSTAREEVEGLPAQSREGLLANFGAVFSPCVAKGIAAAKPKQFVTNANEFSLEIGIANGANQGTITLKISHDQQLNFLVTGIFCLGGCGCDPQSQVSIVSPAQG